MFTSGEFLQCSETCNNSTLLPLSQRTSRSLRQHSKKHYIKKANAGAMDAKILQHFLCLYRQIPNSNDTSTKSPANLMFSRQIRSMFSKMSPEVRDNIRKRIGIKVFLRNPRQKNSSHIETA